MVTTGLDVAALVRKLAAIDDDGQLEALALDWAGDCRGLCDDAGQLFTAAELLRVRRVASVLVQLCGFPADDAKAAARSVLLRHPRRESAINLIAEYTRDAAAFDKLRHERERRIQT